MLEGAAETPTPEAPKQGITSPPPDPPRGDPNAPPAPPDEEGGFIGGSGGVVMGVPTGAGTPVLVRAGTVRGAPRPLALQCGFPEDRKDGVSSGSVLIRVKVDTNGKALDAKVIRDSGGFAEAARQCVLQAQFVPGTDEAGAVVEASTTLSIRYRQQED